MRESLSRLICPYCSSVARPNAHYCMLCGQILQAPAQPASAGGSWNGAGPVDPQAPWQEVPAPPAPAASTRPDAVPESLQTTHLVQMMPTFHAPPEVSDEVPSLDVDHERPALPPTGLEDRQHTSVLITFSTGQVARIVRGAVIGRKPEATARNAGLEAVEVTDDAKSLSRAHVIVEVTDRSARITDLGSSNGTELERGSEREALTVEQRYRLRDGDRIWLGQVSADVMIELSSDKGAHDGAQSQH